MPETGPEAQYLAALRAGHILFQRDDAGRAIFPPRVMAPGSGAPLTWHQASGAGVIYAATRQPRRPPEPPRLIVIVEMAEGFRLISSMQGDSLPAIGTPVTARIETAGDTPAIHFDLAGGPA